MPEVKILSSVWQEINGSPGTANSISLGSARPGYTTFQSAHNSTTVRVGYIIRSEGSDKYEVGFGRVVGSTFRRDHVSHKSSSPIGSLSNLGRENLSGTGYHIASSHPATDWDALIANHSGPSAPTFFRQGQYWIDTSSSPILRIKIYHNGSWVTAYQVGGAGGGVSAVGLTATSVASGTDLQVTVTDETGTTNSPIVNIPTSQPSVLTKTSHFSVAASDIGNIILLNRNGNQTVTLPSGFSAGDSIAFININATGNKTFSNGGGASVFSPVGSSPSLSVQHASCTAINRGANNWQIEGRIT